MKGLLARKLGMTQLFNADGTTSAVTVLEAGPCRVLGLRTTEKDGYSAARIAYEATNENKLTKPARGEFKKANVEPHRHIVEIRGYDGLETGQELKAEIFAASDAARVFKGVRMSGQMGNERTTARAYKVVRVDAERNLILVMGGVPGAKGALVLVRQSTKKQRVKGPAGKPTGRKV